MGRGACAAVLGVVGLAWLSACAATSKPAEVGASVQAVRVERWLITLRSAQVADADLPQHLTRLAGLPVQVLERLTARTMLIGLTCGSEALCDEAATRIRADKDMVVEMRRDAKRRLVQPPAEGDAR